MRSGLDRRHIHAAQVNPASSSRPGAGDGHEGGGFAGAVGTEQGHQFAFADLERYAAHRLDGAVADLQILRPQACASSRPR